MKTKLIAAMIAMLVVSVTMGSLSLAQNVNAQEVTPFPSRKKNNLRWGNLVRSLDFALKGQISLLKL